LGMASSSFWLGLLVGVSSSLAPNGTNPFCPLPIGLGYPI
jgi:hypothetical protein